MKKIIIIALAMTVGYFSAEAQTKKSPCNTVAAASVVPASYTTQGSVPTYPYTKHHIRVWTDDMHNPYEGKPSQQNDGVKKNEQRNINFTMTASGGDLPANDGTR